MKLAIGLPSARGLDARIGVARMLLASHLARAGISWSAYVVANSPMYARTMNTVVHSFLISDETHLLMLEDDVVFEPTEVMRMLGREVDCVGGTYAMKTRGAGMVGVPAAHGQTQGDLVEAERMGLGCTLFSRRALVRAVEANPGCMYQRTELEPHSGQLCSALFDTRLEGGDYIDADVVFFRRLRDSGTTLWIDTGVNLGHIGTHVYTAEDA